MTWLVGFALVLVGYMAGVIHAIYFHGEPDYDDE